LARKQRDGENKGGRGRRQAEEKQEEREKPARKQTGIVEKQEHGCGALYSFRCRILKVLWKPFHFPLRDEIGELYTHI
jgi:hypothetical protein